jgi:hypothetical protein
VRSKRIKHEFETGRVKAKRRARRLAALFWMTFGMGLLVQFFSPHLKIERNAFVMPSSVHAGVKTISPSEIVGRERTIQSISAVLTVGGALGLALHYRRRLFGRSSSGPAVAAEHL